MNREEKLKFIKESHPELYKHFQENIPDLITDVWNATIVDIKLYNAWVAFYCGKLGDTTLMNNLLI